MGFRDDLIDGVKAGACSILNRADTASRWAGGAGFATSGLKERLFSISPLSAASAAAGYFCDSPPLSLGASQFDGGQCPDVEYTVQVTTTRYFRGRLASPNQVTTGSRRFVGPIARVYISDDKRQILVEHDGGDVNPLQSGVNASTYEDLRDVVVARRDGQPDLCGDPLPAPPSLTAGERSVTIDVGGVTAQLAVGNGVLQVNGDVTAPIRINSPDYEFTGELVLNKGDINLNFGGADPRTPCVPKKPETDNQPPADDEPPPDDPEEGGSIIGVIVTTQLIDASAQVTRVPQGDNPDIIIPKLGYVSFRIKVGETYAWTEDVAIKVERQYVHVPGGVPAVAVAGTPRIGVTWVITPVNGVQPSIEFD